MGAGFFAIQILALSGDKAFRAIAPGAFDAKGYALTGQNLLVVLAYMAVFECAGGYITGRMAAVKPVGHAVALGLVTLAMNLAIALFTWHALPLWYQLSALLLIVPMTWLGGQMRALHAGARRT